jgi:UDP-glucose 4-epimerase
MERAREDTPPAAPVAAATVLVTGGAGFIGSHVVDRLLATGHHPRIYDLHPSAYHAPEEVPAVLGDLDELPRLVAAMGGCATVIHLAATADVNQVEAAPTEAERSNARGTLNVLEAARRAGVGRVIFASTIWVYSDTQAELLDESVPLDPPRHLYTATKLAGELYCHSYQKLYGVEHTILRFGIPYGPRARPEAVVPAFVTRALAGEPLTVAGDGTQSRRFVYVEDLADGVVRALAPIAANRVYNMVGSEDVTIAEIAATVRELVGDVEIVGVPGRQADFAGAPVCGERAAAELEWRPSTPFREGVQRYIEWHREAAVPTPALPSRLGARASVGAALLRRAALASGFAALVAVLLLGLAALVPVDGDMDRDAVFAAILLLLLPVMLVGGFEWNAERRGLVRTACLTLAAAEMVLIVLPWPGPVHRLVDGHPLFLALNAVSALLAAYATRAGPRLRSRLLAGAGD